MTKAPEDIPEDGDLSEDEHEELFKALLDPRVRKQIDAMLAEAEARGGETPNEEVFAQLRGSMVVEFLTLRTAGGNMVHWKSKAYAAFTVS